MFRNSILCLETTYLRDLRDVFNGFVIMFWITQFEINVQPISQQQISPPLSVLDVLRSTEELFKLETLVVFDSR